LVVFMPVMSPLTLLLACSGFVAAEECVHNCATLGDQTALLQSHLSRKGELSAHDVSLLHFPSLGSLKDKKHRRSSLAQFEQTAANLVQDRASITPAVVDLAKDIVAMLQGEYSNDEPFFHTCMPGKCGSLSAIYDEHLNDEVQLKTDFGVFAPLLTRFTEIQNMISLYNSEDVAQNGSLAYITNKHDLCRANEAELCTAVGACQSDQSELQQAVDEAEAKLLIVDAEINNEWCGTDTQGEQKDRTVETFRTATSVVFIEYIRLLGLLTTAQNNLNNVSCDDSQMTLEREQCKDWQRHVEAAACQHLVLVSHDTEDLTQSFDRAVETYQSTVNSTTLNVGDRKVEWTTIKKVVCLLTELTNPQDDGDLTDVATTDALAACHSLVVDTDLLDLTYPAVPSLGTLPAPGENPCTAGFQEKYYGSMPLCPNPDSLANPKEPFPNLSYGPTVVNQCQCTVQQPLQD